jgi:putative aldouronate transport system permease protein
MEMRERSFKTAGASIGSGPQPNKRNRIGKIIARDRWLYFMLLPGIVYFILFKYLPMWGVLIAFKNYQPFLGFWQSDWVGLKHFTRFFGEPTFWMLFKNTVVLALYNLFFFFPLPIVVALMLNEVRKEPMKRFIQTMVYPTFLLVGRSSRYLLHALYS